MCGPGVGMDPARAIMASRVAVTSAGPGERAANAPPARRSRAPCISQDGSAIGAAKTAGVRQPAQRTAHRARPRRGAPPTVPSSNPNSRSTRRARIRNTLITHHLCPHRFAKPPRCSLRPMHESFRVTHTNRWPRCCSPPHAPPTIVFLQTSGRMKSLSRLFASAAALPRHPRNPLRPGVGRGQPPLHAQIIALLPAPYEPLLVPHPQAQAWAAHRPRASSSTCSPPRPRACCVSCLPRHSMPISVL